MAAARPENRESAVKRLHQDVLAHTPTAPMTSRVKTWQEWCRAWGVLPFPLDATNVACAAASMKEGSYRSCAQYFSVAVKYQERHLHLRVDEVIHQLIRDFKRSILRGLGPESLKDAFDVSSLRSALQKAERQAGPWDASDEVCVTDAVLIASWFMLREIEFGGLRRSHLYLSAGKIHLLLPVQKTDTQGNLCERSLSCSCRLRRHPFCPYHAGVRHLQRLSLFEDASRATARFAFPAQDGMELRKTAVTTAFRRTLAAAGVATTRPDEAGRPQQRFQGHVCRVSGGQWLIALGISVTVVQLLGRWSSAAINRYIQTAPLLQLPAVTTQAFLGQQEVPSQAISGCSGAVKGGPAPPVSGGPGDAAASGSDGVRSVLSQLASLQEEVESLKRAVPATNEVFVQSIRSRMVRKGKFGV